MADVFVDRDSVQTVLMRVDYVNQDTGATDPSAFTVTLAVVATGVRPVSGDFKAATWAARSADGYKAKVLVGTAASGAGDLAAGRYDVYAKIVAGSETWMDKSPDTLVVR